MADPELLSQAATALGVPEPIVQRSAAARAAANGVDVDKGSGRGPGGGSVTAAEDGAAPAEAAPAEAPEAEKRKSEDGRRGERRRRRQSPLKEEHLRVELPRLPAPATAAAATAVLERPRVVPVLEGRRESHWKLIAGVVGLLTLGLLGGWVLPTLDPLDDPGAPRCLDRRR